MENRLVTKVEAAFTALVPMRHHSERVPGKNYRPLAGRPLYAYILETLLQCPCVSQVVVDTDSPILRDGIADRFPTVRLIDRPERLRGSEVSTNAVLEHDVSLVPSRFYLQTHATNPLLRPATVDRAARAFLDAFPEKDSLFSVTRWHKRLWDAHGLPVNHDPAVLLRTQDLPPVLEENSCLYLFERERFLALKNRLGRSPILFEMDAAEALDIDEERDYALVEAVLRAGLAAGEGRP
jgi:CMP-N-acetylneuraminic acid synthetase